MSLLGAIGGALSYVGGTISNAITGGAKAVYNAFIGGVNHIMNVGSKLALSAEEKIIEQLFAFVVSAFSFSSSAITDAATDFVNSTVYLASFAGPFGPVIAFVILVGCIVGVSIAVHLIITFM